MDHAELIDRIGGHAPPLRRALLAWYRANARDLPWRRTRDPYRIWLSEIMLQQTRVKAVLGYYQRFLDALPTVQALAEADEQRVLKLWEGLGYYSRARNLRRAARTVVTEHGGLFPHAADELQKLPGVGRYTAGAIASIAFGRRAAVLDGNVKRVLARLLRVDQSVDDSAVIRALWAAAEWLVPARAPGDFNQAMMELGARICLPRRPLCRRCPARRLCAAFAAGRQEELPHRRAKKAVPHHDIVVAVIAKRGRYLIGRRPPDAMLGGLWELPGGKIEPGETHAQALVREIREECGLEVSVGEKVTAVEHAYSHFTITLHAYRCEVVAGRVGARWHDELRWIPRSRLEDYAWPAANRKVLGLLRAERR